MQELGNNPVLLRALVVLLASVCAAASLACFRVGLRAIRWRRVQVTRRCVVQGHAAVHYGLKVVFFGLCIGSTAVFLLYSLTMF